MTKERRLSEVKVVKDDFEDLLEEYSELELVMSDLKEIQGLINRGPVYRLSCYFKDYQGTPLKHLTKPGLKAVADSIEQQLQKLPLVPYKVFQFELEDGPIITADFCPEFLLEVDTVEDYLKILINFKDYIDQIEIADAKIDFGMFGDSPAVREEETKFKKLFLN
jgi:hypothetical protein